MNIELWENVAKPTICTLHDILGNAVIELLELEKGILEYFNI